MGPSRLSLRAGFAKQKSSVNGITVPSLVVGLISGGVNTNVVPDKITMRVDRRMIPEEKGPEVPRDLIAFIEKAAGEMSGVAPMPAQPLPGSIATASTLAFALVHKYVDGTPLYRLAQAFERAGVPVSRGALGHWGYRFE